MGGGPVGLPTVNAAADTDLTGLQIEIFRVGGSNFYLGFKTIGEKNFKAGESSSYVVVLTNSSSGLPATVDVANTTLYVEGLDASIPSGQTYNKACDATGFYKLTGNIYATVYEWTESGDIFGKITEPVAVQRIPLLPISTRFNADFFTEETFVSLYEIYETTPRNVDYKIGSVNDNNLVKNLKNKSTSAFETLLSFAKSDTNSLKTGQLNYINDRGVGILPTNLKKDNYYYVYLNLDTVNGKYYSIEDVSLYQAQVAGNGSMYLVKYTDSKFNLGDFNFGETGNTNGNNTIIDNPKTGVETYYLPLSVLVIVGITIYLYSRKHNKFHQL